MRRIVLLGALSALLACGGSPPPPAAPRATSSGERAPRTYSRANMLAALPADALVLMALDVPKLRRSSLATHSWTLLRELPQVEETFASLCGATDDIKYALFALKDVDGHHSWGWLSGIDRDAKLTCAKAVAEQAAKQTKSITRGEYTLETSTTGMTEILWVESSLGFLFLHAKDDKPIGEQQMRTVLDAGGGFMRSDLAPLLDHVDFDAGAVLVMNGTLLKQPGVEGIAISLEADDLLRARIYMLFGNEDRASEMQSTVRTLFAQLRQAGVIDDGEARAERRGLSISVTLNRAQFEWLVQLAIAKHKDPNAPVPPPPSPGSS